MAYFTWLLTDETLVRRLIEKVTVYEDKFSVEFKSGITIDIES